ncbi:potassium channel family protein [Propionivibrio sp.]|uniref:potassium channel family protein n=1 Tax=Propionivibrio sp. TaxID=2212460 RepID=UPI003BF3F571
MHPNSAILLIFRRMRAPLIVLILIYAVSVLGLTLIPGVDANGKPWQMGFFHAFYFISYTATTIGFGEIPYAFTDAQRMWVTFSIYLSVIGWAYAIGTLLALVQDRAFQQAITRQRFTRKVRSVREPFYLVCGYGETGQLLCRAFDHMNRRFVVIDIDATRIDELDLQDLRADAPGLAADARQPDNLLLAGLMSSHCAGVIALTSDDEANLAVAAATRLLQRDLPILCRVTKPEIAANMKSFGISNIINPFETFGQYLALAIRSPGSYQLMEWLTATPGRELEAQREPPRGHWILCGYGRFGQAIVDDLQSEGIDLTVIEPVRSITYAMQHVTGVGSERQVLEAAGIDRAVGIIAGTSNDIANLAIVATAEEINPELFTVLRQNLQSNRLLFSTFKADFMVRPAEIIAHECLGILTTPLLARFLGEVKRRDDFWSDAVVARIAATCGKRVPTTWNVALDAKSAPALECEMGRGARIELGALLRDSSDREEHLPAVPLMVLRTGEQYLLPTDDFVLCAGDDILFASTRSARSCLLGTLVNVNDLDYVLYGRLQGAGWLWRKFARDSTVGPA